MKKILIVADTFLPVVDGVAKFTCQAADSLSRDFEFKILVPDYGLRLHDYNGVKIRYFRTLKFMKIKAGAVYHPAVPNMFTMIKEVRNSDAVFVQSLPYLGAAAIIAAKILKKPVALYFHQIAWEQLKLVVPGPGWFKEMMSLFALIQARFYCNMCDVIMVPSEEIIDILNKSGITAKKRVVRLGVDTKRFVPCHEKAAAKKRLGINPKKMVIGYCGRMSEEKDVITLIKAFLKLSKHKSNLFLLLVGEGERFDKLTLKNRNIRITGFVSDVVPYYDAMDIFVMPSLTETTGLSTIEAMSSGVPVVTTPVGVALTGISNDYNGLIFSRSDVRGLISQLDILIGSKSTREKLSKNGREYILKSYSWDKTAKDVKRLLDEL
jgi:glycosyltransferase involved in cell wall biosynthesis